jgi:hypothetical protein
MTNSGSLASKWHSYDDEGVFSYYTINSYDGK